MEPISAFSLACNILQIIDTSAKVLVKAAECYNDGAAAETSQLSGNLLLLESLSSELKNIEAPTSSGRVSNAESRLREANERCLQLSEKLVRLLNGLRVNEKSAWQAISRSIKTVWYKDKIAELRDGVADSRANLNLAMLLIMHERFSGAQATTMRAHTEAEARILSTFDQQSTMLGAEIQTLSSKLETVSLDRCEDIMKGFCSVHETQLCWLSRKVAEILEQQMSTVASQQMRDNSETSKVAQQRILQSLYYSQMNERKGQISDVYENTYGWIFRDDFTLLGEKDNFMSWLSTRNAEQNVYWISGKPGSGKSALMRFVDQRLHSDGQLLPWGVPARMIKASHFLWKSGTAAQRSFNCLLRSLLYQLLDQVPDLAESSVEPSRWRSVISSERQQPEWTITELTQAVRSLVQRTDCCVLILIDGLDELEDTGGRHEDLVQLIQALASFYNVKICVSSRPENIFRDAFGTCPSLRLQDLTYNDVQTFVRGQFTKQTRLRALSQGDDQLIETLSKTIVEAASGVFLWVYLVVTELLQEARDGASIAELIKIVDKVPHDLDSYFSRIMDSVEPKHRAESSIMFQIALDEPLTVIEEEKKSIFHDPHPLRLVDLSFLEERESDFALHPGYNFAKYDFSDKGIHTRLDSALRRVNSRCRGLLEVKCFNGHTEQLIQLHKLVTGSERGELHVPYVASRETADIIRAYDHHVNFLHRSFRDYLTEPETRKRLEDQSSGRYDVRLFICNARLAQIRSLEYRLRPYHAQLALGLASCIISAMSLDEFKHSQESVLIAASLRPVVEFLAQQRVHYIANARWYLRNAIPDYHTNRDSFIAVAINFDLEAYLKEYLTRDDIRSKMGRPILNNVLHPAFISAGGPKMPLQPNVEILRLVLNLGADPNEKWHSLSVWGAFLESLLEVHYLMEPTAKQIRDRVEAVKILLEYAAEPVLPAEWFPRLPFSKSDPGPHGGPVGQEITTESSELPDASTGMVAVSHILTILLRSNLYTPAESELTECIILAQEKAALRGWTIS